MSQIPTDYLERVYAGVLGKLIGVYLGRPFEQWSHERVMEELGEIRYYVHGKFESPLVVVDDDISGTFTFIRALEEHGFNANITSEQIGKTWLNNVIEKRSVFWWGGNGISTEHTAFLNLKNRIKAPESGAIETNGPTIAEQIGAQIFIDGWAMVAPGQPELAARLAEKAARVSHDGEAVNAAKLWAAMEAEAFVSNDVNHLLETGLNVIPGNSLITQLITDVKKWSRVDNDWKTTRQRIQDNYGYDKYRGVCHIVPNHAIMIMALIYGGHSFNEAMHIINTCGWDTDCNSGNVGCLVALMHGLVAFEDDLDWRGPGPGRVLISSADGGFSINNAANIALGIANYGRRLAGEAPATPPKRGAQFHFTLPGGRQGFRIANNETHNSAAVWQDHPNGLDEPALAVRVPKLTEDDDPVEVMTDTFIDKSILEHLGPYDLMACPLVYPGQHISAVLYANQSNTSGLNVRLRVKAYNPRDDLVTIDGPIATFEDDRCITRWQIPSELENHPIKQIGLAFSAEARFDGGNVWLDSVKITRSPQMRLYRPEVKPADAEKSNKMWYRSWVNAVDVFHKWGPSFFIAHDQGEGLISHGTRQWRNYKAVASDFVVNWGPSAALAVRYQGLHRWYALMFLEDRIALIKAKDENRMELASAYFDWFRDQKYEVSVSVEKDTITASVGSIQLTATDAEFANGGIALIVRNGSLSVQTIEIGRMNDD